MRRFKSCLVVALLVLAVGLSGGRAWADEPPEAKILELAGRGLAAGSDDLRLETLEAVDLPLTGLTLYQAKVVNSQSGEVYGLAVNGAGQAVDLPAARQAEQAARQAKYGSLTPALYDRLQGMGQDETVTVAIWLDHKELAAARPAVDHTPSGGEKGDAPLPPAGPEAEKAAGPPLEERPGLAAATADSRVDAARDGQAGRRAAIAAARQTNRDRAAGQVAALQGPLLVDLAAQGFSPAGVSPYAPLIYVELPRSAIQALAWRPDIDAIYGPNENFDLMDNAKPTQKGNVVDSLGFDGTGTRVAIVEDSRIEFNNPYLEAGATRLPADPNVDQHATATAGMVASQHGTYQGIAQGVDLLSANGTDYADANMSAAIDWAVSQNADTINNSWGSNAGTTSLNEHDRHLDYIVRNQWHVVTVAAGNEGEATGRVTSPARAYNVISVGNHNDNDSLTWDGDTMHPSSSYIDPGSGIQKPEVAAVGGAGIVSTIDASPWTGDVGYGTSYAAPMVAGLAAILQDREAGLLSNPEAVKAIIMATALQNIEGASRLSNRDGAGAVDMLAAFRAADEGWWAVRPTTAAAFPYSYFIYAHAGEKVRAAIAWSSNPNSGYTTDPLEADLDLRVYDPGGVFVTSSTSLNNSYEIVEFTAGATGTYELEITAYRFNGTSEYVAAAWWLGHTRLEAGVPQTLGTPAIARDYFTVTPGNFWQAVGIRSPAGSDYDIYLYNGSAFNDPADHTWLEDSTLGSVAVDFVVIDRNHAPAGSYYPEVWVFPTTPPGSGNYPIAWAGHTADISGPVMLGPYTLAANEPVRTWDIQFSTGQARDIRLIPAGGAADLGLALFDSNPAIPGSFYQGRSQAIAAADHNGPGQPEQLAYTHSGEADWLGLVVFNSSAGAGSFYLVVDMPATFLPVVVKN